MSRLRSAIAIAALLVGSAQAATLYGTNNTQLYALNTGTGGSTLVTGLQLAAGETVIDLTAAGNTLFGLVQQQVGAVLQTRLAEIDRQTGALGSSAFISGIFTNSGPARRIDAIAYDSLSNSFFGVNNGPNRALYRIDAGSGAATWVGALPSVSNANLQYRSLGFDGNGQLYAGIGDISGAGGVSSLVRIDTQTAQQTLLGSTLVAALADLAYDPDLSTLLGGGFSPGEAANPTASLFSLNTQSGEATLIGTGDGGLWAGLAFLPSDNAVPEPDALALAALALLVAGRRRMPALPGLR